MLEVLNPPAEARRTGRLSLVLQREQLRKRGKRRILNERLVEEMLLLWCRQA